MFQEGQPSEHLSGTSLRGVIDKRPHPYVYAQICRHVYEGAPFNKGDILPGNTNWEIEAVQPLPGEQLAIFYLNRRDLQLVVAYRGTDDLSELEKEIHGIRPNVLHEQVVGVLDVVKRANEFIISRGLSLSFTGHALGALFAETAVFYFTKEFGTKHVSAVVFDGPGSKEIIEKLQPSLRPVELSGLDIIEYATIPNSINTFSKHVGTLYFVVPSGSGQLGSMHEIESFEHALQRSSEELTRLYLIDWPVRPSKKDVWMMDAIEKMADKSLSHFGIIPLQHFKVSMVEILDRFLVFKSGRPPENLRQMLIRLGLSTFSADCLISYNIRARGKQCFLQLSVSYNAMQFREEFSVWLEKNGSKSLFGNSSADEKGVLFREFESGVSDLTWGPGGGLPRQDNVFYGQQAYLDQLNILMREMVVGEVAGPVVIAALKGLGGVGKSQIALKLARENKGNHFLRVWFPAENLEMLRMYYIEFAQSLGFPGERPSFQAAFRYLKRWLSVHPGWLIVYDNVTDYAAIESYILSEGGKALITTRYSEWPESFRIVNVEVMSEEDAISLVCGIIGCNDEHVSELVMLLGYLPLALAQASAYIKYCGISVEDYIEKYNKYQRHILADSTLPAGSRHAPVAFTWTTSLIAVEKEAKAKNISLIPYHIMMVCAHLNPDEIPVSILLAWIGEQFPDVGPHELALDQALRLLQTYSLIEISTSREHLKVHRVVQAVFRSQGSKVLGVVGLTFPTADIQWYHKLFRVFHRLYEQETVGRKDEERQISFLPHLQVLVKHFDACIHEEPLLSLAEVLQDIGKVLAYLLKKYKEAQEYYEKALEIYQSHYDEDDPAIAKILTNIANLQGCLGNRDIRKQLLEISLRINQKAYGEDHRTVALTLANLGDVYRSEGSIDEAHAYLTRALAIERSAPRPDITKTLYLLGMVHVNLRQYGRAIELGQEALRVREEHYGADHFSLVPFIMFLGGCFESIDESESAIDILERGLSIQARAPHLITPGLHCGLLSNLGNAYGNLGHWQKKIKLLEQAVALREQFDEMEDSLPLGKFLNNLGNAYWALNRNSEASHCLIRALKIKKKWLGERHSGLISTLQNLAINYGNLGEHQKECELLEEALDIAEHNELSFSLQAAGVLYCLSEACIHLDNVSRATQLALESYKMRASLLGIDYTETKESESLLRQCKERTEAKLRKNSPGAGSVMVLRSENSSEEDDNYKSKKKLISNFK